MASIEFVHPGWFLLLPLPYVIYRFFPEYKTRQTAIKAPFFHQIQSLVDVEPTKGAQTLTPAVWQRAFLLLSWIALVSALAKPLWLGPVETREVSGRDIMIVVDLSGSMETADFVVSQQESVRRIDALKQVLIELSNQRENDRLGLILFGDSAYIQAPFTADIPAWQRLLQQTDVGMAGQSTNLGDAIGLAIKSLTEVKDADKEKVAIIFTDGNDTGSLVPPIDAAKVAKARGITLYVVAMGDPETIGENALDMETIDMVARMTGGRSFIALSQQDLEQVNTEIQALEQTLYSSKQYQPKVSLHYVPVAFVLLLYLTAFSVSLYRSLVRAKRAEP